jgi:hypothetical protein
MSICLSLTFNSGYSHHYVSGSKNISEEFENLLSVHIDLGNCGGVVGGKVEVQLWGVEI